jgi:ammonia channel protein AmtB
MSDEDKETSHRLDIIRKEHERDKYTTYSYILFALDFGFIGLSLISPHLPERVLFLVFVIIFFVWGWVMRRRARRI